MSFKLSEDGKKDVGGGLRGLLKKKSKTMPNTFDAVAGIQYKMNRRLSTMRRPSLTHTASTEEQSNQIPIWVYEHQDNTYQLGPKTNQKFNATAVEKLVTGIMDSFLTGERYSPHRSAQMTRHLSEIIKVRVREMNIPRYKIVCYVLIGQNCDQSIINSSRCVWDTSTDNFATATFINGSLFAVATVYGFYYE